MTSPCNERGQGQTPNSLILTVSIPINTKSPDADFVSKLARWSADQKLSGENSLVDAKNPIRLATITKPISSLMRPLSLYVSLGLKILISYASDFNLLLTSLLPHNVSMFTEPLFVASLDHAMWFHRDVSMDDWLLYTIKSPSASNSRGFCTGRIFTRDGQLLASVTQEGLIRKYIQK